jgi:hypothetical protein
MIAARKIGQTPASRSSSLPVLQALKRPAAGKQIEGLVQGFVHDHRRPGVRNMEVEE